MKKALVILLWLSVASNLMAKITPIIPFDQVKTIKNVPEEFNILVNSLQSYILTQEEKEDFVRLIYSLDHNFSRIEDSQILYYTLNLEIHKSIIEFFPKKTLIQFPNKNSFLKSLRNLTIDANSKTFTSWLLTEIKSDLLTLVSSPQYKTILSHQKKGSRIKDSTARSIKRRIEFLLPWYQLFKASSLTEIEEKLKPIILKILSKIEIKTKLLAVLTSNPIKEAPNNPKELSFFQNIKPDKSLKKEKTYDPILSITNKDYPQDPDELPVAVNDWIPRDDEMISSEDVQEDYDLFPKSSLDYILPGDLPNAVNDWKNQEKAKNKYDFFPTKKENYIIPKKLPLPAREWKPKDL